MINEFDVNDLMGIKDAALDIFGDTLEVVDPTTCAVKILRNAKNYWWAYKVEKFIKKVARGKRDSKAISLQTEKERKENGIRILHAIDKIETEKSIDFLANATISFLEEKINNDQYFRIIKAITNTLYEDLLFLSKNVVNDGTFNGRNMSVMELVRSGLMIQAGINAGADIEEQEYAFTTLGRLVDRHAISYGDKEREAWYANNARGGCLLDAPEKTSAILNEGIDEILGQ